MVNPKQAKQAKSNRGKLNAIEKDVETINNGLQTTRQGAAIGALAAFTFIFMGLLLLHLHEKSYEQKIQKQFDTFKEEVRLLSYQQTAAIKSIRELIELVKPLAQHRELQLLDYFRNEIWKWEEEQRQLELKQKEEEEKEREQTAGSGSTKHNDTGPTKRDRKPVKKGTGSNKKKAK